MHDDGTKERDSHESRRAIIFWDKEILFGVVEVKQIQFLNTNVTGTKPDLFNCDIPGGDSSL